MAHIYLISAHINEKTLYKIGYTEKEVIKRLKQLQTGNASKLEIEKTYTVLSSKSKLEKMILQYYKSKRLVGEWFDLDENDVLNFENICKRYDNTLYLLRDNHFYDKI